MASKPETLFRKRFDKLLKELIPGAYSMSIQQMALGGYPDKIICIRGFLVGLELKKDSKSKATKLQAYVLKKIRAAGGYAKVVHPDNMKPVLWELLAIDGGQTPDELQEGEEYEFRESSRAVKDSYE